MPLVQTRGAASAQGFGEFAQASGPANYIEDVFSCFLYTGNGSTQTITNGIDLSGKGGLVWTKIRNETNPHGLVDTVRGATNRLISSSTAAQSSVAAGLTAFNSSGYSLGSDGSWNANTYNYVSWTFRKQPKFFDVVAYTGTGAGNTINHNLGSKPGCIIIKRTDSTGDWFVVSRKADNDYALFSSTGTGLNNTATANGSTAGGDFSATTINIGALNSSNNINASGGTYVAYLFAHNAGGFGLTGTDNVISCGSFSVPPEGPSTAVTLGYEPQWLLVKKTNGADNWIIFDTMRGWKVGTAATDANDEALWPNLSDAANPDSGGGFPTATGFVYPQAGGASDSTYIYIAIRRGPMKVPTLGTSVFSPLTRNGTGAAASVTTVGFPPDIVMVNNRDSGGKAFVDKLRGPKQSLITSDTGAEATSPSTKDVGSFNQNGISFSGGSDQFSSNSSGQQYVNWYIRRSPSVFDIVCYTGTGSNTTFTHNLTVVPELMIVRNRTSAGYGWLTYSVTLGATKFVQLNSTAAEGTVTTYWNNTAPTSSVFSVGTAGATNASSDNFVAYLFATCAGVSKVGSYTGNGTSQTIPCGFGAGGARFVLIKRTDSTSDWYAYDTARGMTVLVDPYIPLNINGANAEVATLGSVITVSTGFALDSSVLADINVNNGIYIFLAIA